MLKFSWQKFTRYIYFYNFVQYYYTILYSSMALHYIFLFCFSYIILSSNLQVVCIWQNPVKSHDNTSNKLFSPLMSGKEEFYFQCHEKKHLLPLDDGRRKHWVHQSWKDWERKRDQNGQNNYKFNSGVGKIFHSNNRCQNPRGGGGGYSHISDGRYEGLFWAWDFFGLDIFWWIFWGWKDFGRDFS